MCADLSSIYNFVFGYKTDGLFVEVGAYDGESFSNTSCLAGMLRAGGAVQPHFFDAGVFAIFIFLLF